MVQAKFSLEEAQIHFLNRYKNYGFKDKSHTGNENDVKEESLKNLA